MFVNIAFSYKYTWINDFVESNEYAIQCKKEAIISISFIKINHILTDAANLEVNCIKTNIIKI